MAATLSCLSRQLHRENPSLCPSFPPSDSQLIQLLIPFLLLQCFSQAVTGALLSSQGTSWSVLWSRSLDTSPGCRAINKKEFIFPYFSLGNFIVRPCIWCWCWCSYQKLMNELEKYLYFHPFPLSYFLCLAQCLDHKCFCREVVFFFYMFMAFILIFILISINSLFHKKLQKLCNLDAALRSHVHFQMAPELKATPRLHPLACLLWHHHIVNSHSSPDGKILISAQLFYIGDLFWIGNLISFLQF